MTSRITALSMLLCSMAASGCQTTSPPPGWLCRLPGPAAKVASKEAPGAAAPVHPPTLIRGATVWTARGEILRRADVLFRGGKIVQVGQGIDAAGAQVVDGRDRHLTPGLIDPHSHLGILAAPALRAHGDVNELGRTISADLRAADAVWPQDPAIPRALAAGVTTAQILPGSANLIGGRGVVIKLRPARSAAAMKMAGAPGGLKMACGENPKHHGGKDGPNTRMGSVARVREIFSRAAEYRVTMRRHRDQLALWREKTGRMCGREGARGRSAGEKAPSLPPAPPKRDAALEALIEVMEGRLRVNWHCYRADEMLAMMKLASRFGFRIHAFHHAVEAYKIRDALQAAGTGAVTWIDWWGFKSEVFDAIPENAALLTAAGALAALHSDSPLVIQRLNQEAAKAYYRGRAAGLSTTRDAAIRMVTHNPALVLGIDHLTGSIAPGKAADLVLWDGDPFSVYTLAEKVWIDGRLSHERGRRRPTDFELAVVPAPGPLSPATTGPAAAPPTLGPAWSVAAPRVAPRRAAPADRPVAIVGARILTMTGPPLERGTVLIEGGAIKAVGRQVSIPAGARVIRAAGKIVTPGLIAAGSALGLIDISAEPTARDHAPGAAAASSVHAALRVWDAINPNSATIPVNRIEGFTTAVVRPFGGLINGQAAAFDLRGLEPADNDLTAPVAMYVSMGYAGARIAGSRALALSRLRQLLDDARLLKKQAAAAEARRLRRLSAPLADLRALAPVIDGKVPLVVHVHRASDILAVLRLAAAQKVRLVLGGAAEAWRVAGQIARARVPVLVQVDSNLPRSFEALGARYDNAARLHRAGVVVGFGASGNGPTEAAHNVRRLRQLAGMAVARGLPHEAALAALTSVPARIFGLADKGVLRPGARANLVLWSGDPLELGTRVERLFIGGREVPLTSRQTLLRQRYLKLK